MSYYKDITTHYVYNKEVIKISKELTINQNIVGTTSYFRYINEQTFLGSLMMYPEGYYYASELNNITKRIFQTTEQVYDDLKKYIQILHNISDDKRQNTIKFLLGLYDIANITGNSSGKIDDCIRLLSLNSWDTGNKSRASDREIDDAVNIVKNGSYLNSSDRLDTIKKAIDWGYDYAINNDLEKVNFLQAIYDDENRDFLADIWNKIWYTDNERDFTGKCGKVICTKDYIDYLEQEIFGRDIGNFYSSYNGDRRYKEQIMDSLEHIKRQVENHLSEGERNLCVICPQNRENILRFAKEIDNFINCNLESVAIKYFKQIAIEDITDRLSALMKKAESELSFYNEVSRVSYRKGIPYMTKQDDIVKLLAFVENVKTGAKYDLKNIGMWEEEWYIFDGKMVRYDAPGNISFGYIGRVFGYDEKFLKLGAGIYQVYSGTSDWNYIGSFFDDPYDTEMIQIGIDYYNKTH